MIVFKIIFALVALLIFALVALLVFAALCAGALFWILWLAGDTPPEGEDLYEE